MPTAPLRPPPARGLLVISPGVGQAHMDSLYRAACALSAVGVRRLLLREPALDAQQVRSLAARLLARYPRDGLLLHEKCAGAREAAGALGLGLHLSGSADWAAERRRTSGPLGVSAHSVNEVMLAAQMGLEWAFLSPVFQPTSKPLDTRPHLGETAIVSAQRACPTIVVHALGGIKPDNAASLTQAGVGGICVLGGVWKLNRDGSAEANTEAAKRYVGAIEDAMRLRGGLRFSIPHFARSRRPRHPVAKLGDAKGQPRGIGSVVGYLHGGKYQFGPVAATSADDFAASLAAGGRHVSWDSGEYQETWMRLNPNLARVRDRV
eukprot:scaffold212969_cov28-Tisochrysis_lutea.AAC.1